LPCSRRASRVIMSAAAADGYRWADKTPASGAEDRDATSATELKRNSPHLPLFRKSFVAKKMPAFVPGNSSIPVGLSGTRRSRPRLPCSIVTEHRAIVDALGLGSVARRSASRWLAGGVAFSDTGSRRAGTAVSAFTRGRAGAPRRGASRFGIRPRLSHHDACRRDLQGRRHVDPRWNHRLRTGGLAAVSSACRHHPPNSARSRIGAPYQSSITELSNR
jgi:hypothetical protein